MKFNSNSNERSVIASGCRCESDNFDQRSSEIGNRCAVEEHSSQTISPCIHDSQSAVTYDERIGKLQAVPSCTSG